MQYIGDIVHLNGTLLPLAEAKISPLDRGFLFGDGVYEVVPVYSRRPFRLEQHLGRLQQSLDGIGLDNPHTGDGWRTIVNALVTANPWDDQGIYLQVTRGADVKRDHPFPTVVTPTVFGMSMPLVMPAAEVRERGITAITAEDTRWSRCDLKTTSLLANVLLRQQSVDAEAGETILLRDGFLTEGSAASVLIVSQGVLVAPPPSRLILPGVTYDVVLELAIQHGVLLEVRPIAEEELRTAEEIWLLSSTKEVLAVTRLDDRPVGVGLPGPLGKQMWQWYQAYKNTVMRGD